MIVDPGGGDVRERAGVVDRLSQVADSDCNCYCLDLKLFPDTIVKIVTTTGSASRGPHYWV